MSAPQTVKAIIFDTETTGFVEPEIIEAAWVSVASPTDTEPGASFHQFFKPAKTIELGALSTHHILDSELEWCGPPSDFKLPDSVEYIIGHNVDFDWAVSGKPDVKRICTLALSRWLFPDIGAHTQTAMMYHFLGRTKETRELTKGAHSAFYDVLNCLRVFDKLMADMINRDYDVDSWESLWELSEKARIPTVMTFGKHKGEKIKDIPKSYVSWLLKQDNVDSYLVKALEGVI